jgi:hypothetical protein
MFGKCIISIIGENCYICYMDALIVYPENKEQLTALKAVMKAMKISFEQKSEVYPDHVINGVKESLKEAREEQLTPYTGIRDMLNLA